MPIDHAIEVTMSLVSLVPLESPRTASIVTFTGWSADWPAIPCYRGAMVRRTSSALGFFDSSEALMRTARIPDPRQDT